jgi:hypothetical protein
LGCQHHCCSWPTKKQESGWKSGWKVLVPIFGAERSTAMPQQTPPTKSPTITNNHQQHNHQQSPTTHSATTNTTASLFHLPPTCSPTCGCRWCQTHRANFASTCPPRPPATRSACCADAWRNAGWKNTGSRKEPVGKEQQVEKNNKWEKNKSKRTTSGKEPVSVVFRVTIENEYNQ